MRTARRRARLAVATGLATAASFAAPVSSAQPPVFRSGVELIDVAVVVRDKGGRFVENLTARDFEIVEGGVPQAIAAFDRVSIPVVTTREERARPAVASEVGTNEGAAEGRIFVLVLDALHVSPLGVAVARQHARRFIEGHVGPTDLAAVMSPGATAEATQDFTNDKGRLLAAIDRFSGTKLRSATLELEDERRLAGITVGPMHGGKDPSDQERADRARSLQFENLLALSAVTLTSMPAVLMVTRGDGRMSALLRTPPTAARAFVAGDRIVAAVEAYIPASARAPVAISTEVHAADGGILLQRAAIATARPIAETSFAIDTGAMEPGDYVLRIRAGDAPGGPDAERRIPFRVLPNPVR